MPAVMSTGGGDLKLVGVGVGKMFVRHPDDGAAFAGGVAFFAIVRHDEFNSVLIARASRGRRRSFRFAWMAC